MSSTAARQDLDPGWWRSQTGPAQILIVAVAAVTALVLLYVFVLSAPGPPRTLPSVVGQGSAIAEDQLRTAGFGHVENHDAWGRDRDADGTDWQVCFQSPAAGPGRDSGGRVRLGLVLTSEACPPPAVGDRGVIHQVGLRAPMPDLRAPIAWTAYLVRESFGDDASIRFVERNHPRTEVDRDLGDWKVCSQSPAPGPPWAGRPLTITVAPFDTPC